MVAEGIFSENMLALGKNSTPCAFIMPERLAQTDPFKQIPEYIGSGPMKFAKSEWVPGAKAVFEKFTITCRGRRRRPGSPAAADAGRPHRSGW